MNSFVGSAVGTDGHADGAAGTNFAPKFETAFIIKFPLSDAVMDALVALGD